MISTAGLHWWMSKHGLRTRRSVSVFIHSEETPRFSLESVANHDHWPRTAVKTQQGCWCRSFRLFTSLLPTRLLDHYWCNLWVKRTQTCFWAVEQTIAGASEELDSENLLQGVIGMVCKHDKSMHKPVTKDQEQQASLVVYHELVHFSEIQYEVSNQPCLLWLTKHA